MRINRHTAGPVACLVAAAACAVAAARSYNGLDGLGIALQVIVVAPIAAAVLRRLVRGVVHGGHRVAVETHRHGDTVDRADVRIHEAGHWVVGRALGGHGGYAEANPDGSGVVVMYHRRKPSTVERVAMARAGAMAEGSDAGAEFDKRNARRALSREPRADRARQSREADQLAARILRRDAGKVRHVAAKLRSGVHR